MRFQLSIIFISPLLQFVHGQDNSQSSGSYLIRYCPTEKVIQLQALIPAFQKQLNKVVNDVPLGTRSNAYSTFFKSVSNIPYVYRVFSRMEEGDVVLNLGNGPPFERLKHPTVVCFDRSIPVWEGIEDLCGEGVFAAVVPEREEVVLCDSFWTLPYQPLKEQCPLVRRNRFIPDDHSIADNKFGVFVHQFAHIYLSNWKFDSAFNLMDAARLDKELSLTNPNNFVLYASMVVAGCEDYVNSRTLPRIDDSA